jgi:hypothetical protein
VVVAMTVNTHRQSDIVKSELGLGAIVRPYSTGTVTHLDVNRVLAITPTFLSTDTTVGMYETSVTLITDSSGVSSTLTGATAMDVVGLSTPLLFTTDLEPEALIITDPSVVGSTLSVSNYYFPRQQDFSPGLCIGSEAGSDELVWVDTRLSQTSYGVVSARRWSRANTPQNLGSSSKTNVGLSFPGAPPPMSSAQTNSPDVSLVAEASTNGVGLVIPFGKTVQLYFDMSIDNTNMPAGTVVFAWLTTGPPVAGQNQIELLKPTLNNAFNTISAASTSFVHTTDSSNGIFIHISYDVFSPGATGFTLLDYNIVAVSV